MSRVLAAVAAGLFLMMVGGVTNGFAAQGALERSLRNTVEQILILTERLGQNQQGTSEAAAVAALQEMSMELQAGHLLMAERMNQREAALRSAGEEQQLRQRQAAEHYRALMNKALALLPHASGKATLDRSVLAELRLTLRQLAPPRSLPILGLLPYARAALPAVSPVITPPLVPAYRSSLRQDATAADLAATPEAPLSPAIVEQVSAIAGEAGRTHWDPAAIYNWLRANIRTEWYRGCMKGAEETLRQRSGNDADQAALLVAMLRAAGYPARYVRGVIEFFPGLGSATAMTGIADPSVLLDFFRAAGIPCEPVYAGTAIVNIRLEHLWVEALVPYADYRGIVAGNGGQIWVPLDTSIKTGAAAGGAAIDLFTRERSLFDGFRDRYLGALRDETPLEMLERESQAYLDENFPGHTFADALHNYSQPQPSLGILPSSLQFVEIAVTGEYAELPEEWLHQVHFSASVANQEIFNLTVPLHRLSNRRVMISYTPETVADQETINQWGGLDNTPSYLVRLRPTLLLEEEPLAVGREGLAPGEDFLLNLAFRGPGGEITDTSQVTAGYPLLLGIAAQNARPPSPPEANASAVERLHRGALAYIAAWDREETRLAELLNLAVARPFPTCVRAGGTLRGENLAGAVMSTAWEGLFVDARMRRIEAVPRQAADPLRVRTFMELSALSGSVGEHELFREEFGVEGISTAKLLGLAAGSGVPVVTLDAGNATAQLPALGLDEAVTADILAAVDAGLRVSVPTGPLPFHAWQGTGYLKEDPLSGEAGYMLSGGLAGGQTVLGRRDWPAELAAILAEPFTGPPNEDPVQAATLAAVTPPELRLATAGEELPAPLMTLVRDAAGIPVAGALVTYAVRSGGGWLIDDRQSPEMRVATLTVMSERDGIARARFVPGEQTAANPVVFVREGDRQANLVGENLLDARLLSGSQAALAAPIAIFGFAGLPEPQLSRAYGHNLRAEVFSYSGDVLLLLKDRFGNPVANHPVTFSAGAVQPAAASRCQNSPGLADNQRDARLLGDAACRQRTPVYGECAAAAQLQVVSRSDGGALSGVVLGGVPSATYPVSASYATGGGVHRVDWQHYSQTLASCVAPAAPESRLVLGYPQRLDGAGRNVDARPAGQPAQLQIKAYLVAEDPVIVPGGDLRSCSSAPPLACPLVAGNGAVTLAAPSTVTIAGQPAMRSAPLNGSQELPWLYQGEIALPAGLSEVAVEAAAHRILPRIVNSCDGCGQLAPAVDISVGPLRRTLPIWGVTVRAPEAATVLVNAQGISQRNLQFGFAIEPAAYVANQAQVLLLRNGELWDTLPAGTTGTTAVTFPAGYWFDPKGNYELQVLLNNAGEANEIRSGRIPLLQRTAAVDLRVDGLPDLVEDQVGAFVLVNNDYDEHELDPTVTFPDVATPSLAEDDDELQRAWLQLDDSGGQGGSWRITANDPTKLRIYHRKDGAWVEFKPDDPPEPVPSFPAVIPLYLEGLAESEGLHNNLLTATFLADGGGALTDTLPLTVVDIDLAVDGDRDRAIDFQKKADERGVFWVNNDHDYRHEEDDLPVEDDAASGDDSRDAVIACKRDLEDFARLHIRLGTAARPGALTYSVKLVPVDDQVQPMLNLFPAVNLSDGYLGLPGNGATPDQPDEQVKKNLMASAGKLEAKLPAESLTVTGENPFLFEGRMPGRGDLVLTASYQGLPVATRKVALELVDPSWFYDHFVVSLSGAADDSPVNTAVNPEGLAGDATRLGHHQPDSDDYVLFVHGWNMQSWEKRRWAETVFKRLWWQGYRGKVGLFDWPCRTLPSWDFLVNYDRSEFIAWQAATALKGVLERLQGEHAGKVRLLAHSQGNVVAGEALRLGAPGLVHTYVASQAALSAGLHKSDLPTMPDFEPKTPDVMSIYPADPNHEPYFEQLSGKVGAILNYFNAKDYALTGDSLVQPTWLLNNKTRPDGSLGYGYQGGAVEYPPPLPALGFYRAVGTGDPGIEPVLEQRNFPDDSYEIFSYCAQSWTCALGAMNVSTDGLMANLNLESFGFNGEKSSHSRQFRSNVVDEQPYWQKFTQDTGILQVSEGGR